MTQHQESHTTELVKLSDTPLVVADASQDIRGRKVLDRTGEEIGHVSDLFIDRSLRRVRMLEIRAGGFLGFGERHVLLPIDALTSVTKHAVHVSETRERLAKSPVYDPTLIMEPQARAWAPFYGYYGLQPYWSSGYLYPEFPLEHDVKELHREKRPRPGPLNGGT
jgi:sporulation protein YlmC with PRC-barrel domain